LGVITSLAFIALAQSRVGSIPSGSSHWPRRAIHSNSSVVQPQQHIFGSHPLIAFTLGSCRMSRADGH
jgi:hypothetical protein